MVRIRSVVYGGGKGEQSGDSCGKRARTDAPKGHLSGMTVKQMIRELGSAIDTGGLSREELCRLLRLKRWTRRTGVPLENDGENSCFLDSALVALFHRRSSWLDKYVVKKKAVQPPFQTTHKALLRVVNKIRDAMEVDDSNANVNSNSNSNSNSSRGSDTCESLRRMFRGRAFREFNEANDIDWDGVQQDPIDVIHILEHMYGLPQALKVHIQGPSTKRHEKWSMSSWQIPGFMLAEKKTKEWTNVFPKLHDDGTKTTTTFLEAPFMYVQLHRYTSSDEVGHGAVKNTKPFAPTSMIATPKGLLTLVSIVIHIGSTPRAGHYTALLKTKEGPWLYYNDLNQRMEVAGLYLKQALDYKNKLGLTNGVGFVYMKE